MKHTKKKIVWFVVFLGVASIQVFGKPFAKGPYLGQTPPGPIAKVFAPGLICNTGRPWEAFGTFSADGNTFCFHRRKGIFITENTEQGWTAPTRIESISESNLAPWSPCLSPDANSIFFTIGDRYPRVKHYDLYRCMRTSHGWAKPQRLEPPLSSPSNEITCSLAANNSIYLGSGRKGSDERSWIWVAPFVGNTWPRADHITLNLQQPLTKHGPVKSTLVDHTWPRAVHISLNHQASDPGIAPDESFMVFTAKDLSGGYGHRDLYLTLRLRDGTWSKPRNLGPRINTTYIEHGPRITPDKKYLFFNRSNGWDPGIHAADIYWVELKEYLPESYR